MPNAPVPGHPIRFVWRKWDGSPHWEHDAVYLGSDEFGHWVGQAAGARSVRPGRDVRTENRNVTLIPPTGTEAVTFNLAPASYEVYIDVAWDVRFDPATPTGIDMDLDVVRTRGTRATWVDDEDEWAEHAAQYGYPPEVMRELEARTAELVDDVRAELAPYDQATPARWFAVLDGLTAAT